MAKQTFNLNFQKAYISLEENTITEHLNEAEVVHVLSDVLNSLEGKQLNITFKETKEIAFGQE